MLKTLQAIIKDITHNKQHIALQQAHKKITSSIKYAKRIQDAILGDLKEITQAFKEHTAEKKEQQIKTITLEDHERIIGVRASKRGTIYLYDF